MCGVTLALGAASASWAAAGAYVVYVRTRATETDRVAKALGHLGDGAFKGTSIGDLADAVETVLNASDTPRPPSPIANLHARRDSPPAA